MSMIRCAARTASLLRSMPLHLRALCTAPVFDTKLERFGKKKKKISFTDSEFKERIGMSWVPEEIVSDSSSLTHFARSPDFQPTKAYVVYLGDEIEFPETAYDIYKSMVRAVLGDKGWDRALTHYYTGCLYGFSIRMTEHEKNMMSKYKGVVLVFEGQNLPFDDPWKLSRIIKDMFSGSGGAPRPDPDPSLVAHLNETKEYEVRMKGMIRNQDINIQAFREIAAQVLGKDEMDSIYARRYTGLSVRMTEKQKEIMSKFKEIHEISEDGTYYLIR